MKELPELLVIDNFINDKNLIKQMKNPNDNFWKLGYSFWQGWWKSPAINIRHKLIEYIWRDNCPDSVSDINLTGFEHWVGILDKNTTIGNEEGYALNHHFDKDEGLFSKTKEIKTPIIGTVYYPITNEPQCKGGYLKIYDTHQDDLTAPYELIAPRPNRLVIFDAGKLHAVQEIKEGIRKSVIINLWDNEPSTEMKERY